MPSATTTLPPEPSSSRACRQFLRATLHSWGADQFADEGLLLLSELVTNAVLHAGTEIEVVLQLEEGVLRVEVRDNDPRLPSRRHYSQLSGTGRGLAMVAAMARAWNVEPLPAGGKCVWFELGAAHG